MILAIWTLSNFIIHDNSHLQFTLGPETSSDGESAHVTGADGELTRQDNILKDDNPEKWTKCGLSDVLYGHNIHKQQA